MEICVVFERSHATKLRKREKKLERVFFSVVFS
jgi:hypothetical protein